MKGKQITLKQAATLLKTTDYPFSVVTIRKAIKAGKLKAVLNTASVPYYMIYESDLLVWAVNTKQHKSGHKTH